MKKLFKCFLTFTMATIHLFCFSACNQNMKEKTVTIKADTFVMPSINCDTYDNLDFSDYPAAEGEGESRIEDQW